MVAITGNDILDDFVIGIRTSIEFHYHTLVMKGAQKRPEAIMICAKVFAMSDVGC